MSFFTEPSSPSCAQLYPQPYPQPHPPAAWGHPSLCVRGAHADQHSWGGQAGASGACGFKASPASGTARSPQAGWEVACPRLCSSPWPLWCRRGGRAGGPPQGGTCLKGLSRAGTIRLAPPSPTTAVPVTALPRWPPRRPAGHPGLRRPGLGSNPGWLATPCASGTPRRWESCPKAVPSCERASSFPACSPKTSPTFLLN